MSYDNLGVKLKQLRIEYFIWLIYIAIIFMSWYANSLERKYFICNDIKSRDSYRKMMILIFSVLMLIYIYFLQDSFNDVKNINSCDSKKKKKLIFLSFIGSLLIVISGFIFLYIAIMDEQIDIELAFN